jgi:hypothetical protein
VLLAEANHWSPLPLLGRTALDNGHISGHTNDDTDWTLGTTSSDPHNIHHGTDAAPMEALCGYAAQTASLTYPAFYPAALALQPQQPAQQQQQQLVWISSSSRSSSLTLLPALLQACPNTLRASVQLILPLPDEPVERLTWLTDWQGLLWPDGSRPTHTKQTKQTTTIFTETTPMGLETRLQLPQQHQSTTQQHQQHTVLDLSTLATQITHVVWVLDDDPEEMAVATQIVRVRQMLRDLQAATTGSPPPSWHLLIVWPRNDPPALWLERLLRLEANELRSVTFLRLGGAHAAAAALPALVTALQVRHPTEPWLSLDLNKAATRQLLQWKAPANDSTAISSLVASTSPAALDPLLCASECSSSQDTCLPSAWDETASLTRNVTEGCQVVVLTQAGSAATKDLPTAEDRDEVGINDWLTCNVAFVAQSSLLVQSVIQKVPNADLVRLGVTPQPGDDARAIHTRKLHTLNGKLLYRGWILVWVDTTWTENDESATLLKVSPGRFFAPDVEYALYCEATVTPSWEDIQFLLQQMRRSAWPARNAKLGTQHYRLPAEPPRRAILLVSALEHAQHHKLNLKKAVSLWHEQQQPVGYNVTRLLQLATRYDEFDVWMNRQRHQRRYYKPPPLDYRYQLKHWARTRWVLHDVQYPEVRCEWYRQRAGGEALALSHVLAVRDMRRRLDFGEPDDHTLQHTWKKRMAFTAAVTDRPEWIPLQTDTNERFAQVDYQLETATASQEMAGEELYTDVHDNEIPLYVRIMSDRVMAAARQAYHR